ncbi:AraC family transcriptional regulator [Sphingobacterium sp. CZ-2]|uniref:AraC family transcriptional regulator n=1 Tax=Sphingobacterium sp. CZ-2 TaxID=2557994 RepID=UPI00106F3D50|nr:helix-turn-helix transcriptional regulator [Sphingobacterium sp. CZ-2]QBR11569.1 AraC family transcriptional regulator [Sphingobacterium sp. CZ-2]
MESEVFTNFEDEQTKNVFGFAEEDIVFSENFDEIGSDRFKEYCIHILCYRGKGKFQMSNKTFKIKAGNFIIWTHGKLVSHIHLSNDFQATVLYISNKFLRRNSPNNNYGIKGNLLLLQNPVLNLSERDKAICDNNLRNLKSRFEDKSHHFYQELLGCLVEAFVLDLFDIHVRINEEYTTTDPNAHLLRRFLALVESGEYIENREVAYYASKLFVTPKHLSEICKKVSGQSALFWINRFTITEIARLLKNKELTLTDIAEKMNFSSISYFSRYVQRNLGVSPTEYRQKMNKS